MIKYDEQNIEYCIVNNQQPIKTLTRKCTKLQRQQDYFKDVQNA